MSGNTSIWWPSAGGGRKCPLCGGRVETRRRGATVVMECAACSSFSIRQRPDSADPHTVLVLVESDFACGVLRFRYDEYGGASQLVPVQLSDGRPVSVRLRNGMVTGYKADKGGTSQRPDASQTGNPGSNSRNPLEEKK